MTNIMNTTTSGVIAMSSMSSYLSIPITIIITICILGIAFIMFTNFRRFIYGLCILVPLALAGLLGNKISHDTTTGNYFSIKIFGIVCGVISCSIVIGKYLETTKFIKNIEKDLK